MCGNAALNGRGHDWAGIDETVVNIIPLSTHWPCKSVLAHYELVECDERMLHRHHETLKQYILLEDY